MGEDRRFLGVGRNVFVAGLVSLFMDISSEMTYPLVPLFLANVLAVNKSLIGLIEGIAESTASLLKVFSGWYSDRIGKRKGLMTVGYTISTVSKPLLALASSWQHVLVFRFIDRFGKGVRTAPRDAIIAESADKRFSGRAFGFHRSMDTMGAVVGPLLAFYLLGVFSNEYRIVFWASIIPAAIAVLLTVLFIKEKRLSTTEPGGPPRLNLRDFDGRFVRFLLVIAIFALGNSSDVFLILRAQQIGIPPRTIPVVYLLFNIIYSISSIFAGLASDKFGRRRVILSGFLLFAIVYYGFAVADNTKIIWVLFAFYGIFMGLTEGVQKAFVNTITPPAFKATAFGVYNMVVGLAMFPASLLGGWLWDHVSPSATFYFGSITAGLSAILFTSFVIFYRKI